MSVKIRGRPRTCSHRRTGPDAPAVEVEPRAGTGYGATEAPRGLLYHRYRLDEDGTILDAQRDPLPRAPGRALLRVVGIGDPWRGDDAARLTAAGHLRGTLPDGHYDRT